MEEQKEEDKDKDNNSETKHNLDIIDSMANDVLKNSLSRGIFENKKIKQIFSHVLKRTIKNFTIDKNTIVYQLPGTGDSKFKNYDKIAQDIKNVEISIKKEIKLKKKKRELNKDSKNDNLTKSNYFSDNFYDEEKEDEKMKKNIFNAEEYNLLLVIQKLKIPPEKRTIEDLYHIKNFLFQTKLTDNYITEFNNDKKIIEDMITFYALEFRYKKYEKGETIFKIGDLAENFYIVLFGKVDLLKILTKSENMSGYEYFCYIMDLLKKKEIYRYKLCINVNKKIFPIESEDEDILPYIFLHYVLKDIYDGRQEDDFISALDIVGVSPKKFGFGENKVITNEYIYDNYKYIRKKFPKIPDDKIREYRFINSKVIKKNVKIYDYNKFMTFEALDFFGENSIENNTNRNGTMVCVEDTEVLYLPSRLYLSNILTKKAIILERKTAFLSKNYLFNKIPQKKFEKRYFSWFILETYHKDEILFRENDKLENVYFIKQGNVKLVTSKSIIELEIFINEINKKIKVIQNIFNNNNVSNEPEISNLNYNNLNADSHELLKHINKKEFIKLFILKESEDIGTESYLLGLNHINTCIISSTIAKIYKIDIKYLTELFQNEKICFYELIDRVENKLKLYSERLFEINNTKLAMTDQKITEEKNKIYQTEFSDISNISSFSPNNKIDFNFNKLKEMVNYNNNNKSSIISLKNKRFMNLNSTLPNLYNKGNFVQRSVYDNYVNLNKNMSPKNRKGKYKNSLFNISNSNSNNNTNYNKTTSLSLNQKMKSNNLSNEMILKINLMKRQKEFPYEDEFLSVLKNDFNYLLKEKLMLTRTKDNNHQDKATLTKNFSFEMINNKNIQSISVSQNNNNTISNTQTNENYITGLTRKNFLLTQIDNFNNNLKDTSKFLLTEDSFKKTNNDISISKKILNNNKIYSSEKNRINLMKNILTNEELKKQNSLKKNENINIFNSSKIWNKKKKIKHPYVCPLTLIKLKRYKIFAEKDKFLEDKKRLEMNIQENYKKRGLNQFGYPISYDKKKFRKYNYSSKIDKEGNLG